MNTALIISSYDGSEDLWNTLEQTYKKFWNDIELPIFLSTNHKNFSSNLFNTIKIGKEISWSDNLIKTLNQINQKDVTIFLNTPLSAAILTEKDEALKKDKLLLLMPIRLND